MREENTLRRLLMVPQVSSRALEILKKEVRSSNNGTFGRHILSRLRNENPRYAYLADFLMNTVRDKFNEEGSEVARDIVAICYRIIELAEKYPERISFPEIVFDEDPLLRADLATKTRVAKETRTLLKKFTHPRK